MGSAYAGMTVGVVLVVKGGFETCHCEAVVGRTVPFDRLRANMFSFVAVCREDSSTGILG